MYTTLTSIPEILADDLVNFWSPRLYSKVWSERLALLSDIHGQIRIDIPIFSLYANVSMLFTAGLIERWGEGRITCAAQAYIYANSAHERHRWAAERWLVAHPGAKPGSEPCQPSPPERRRAHRRQVNRPTTLTAGSRTVACSLLDLSPGGALVEAPTRLMPGETVHLDVPNRGPSPASVVRVAGRRIGLRFVAPLAA